VLVSVIIRTYNEEKYLGLLLRRISTQANALMKTEIVIVDSGSTDNTLTIAKKYGCRITYIDKSDFTYGRSLNVGCEFAQGDFLVFISGHCIPVDEHWLDNLLRPLINQNIAYSYGRQQGKDTTKFSEYRHFEKCFPCYSKQPQEGFFCNNANAAITKTTWQKFKFNEELTGLEDMFIAKQLIDTGEKIAYVTEASVYHIHDENWRQISIRYEREAYALQCIMPEIHFTLNDFIQFYFSSIFSDGYIAIQQKVFWQKMSEILMFRAMQYWGTYKGNHQHRKLSRQRKLNYFYPKDLERDHYEP
jgi:glycosyltransferase involved in cell wall biosynthesis